MPVWLGFERAEADRAEANGDAGPQQGRNAQAVLKRSIKLGSSLGWVEISVADVRELAAAALVGV
jgi:hypothetical protein